MSDNVLKFPERKKKDLFEIVRTKEDTKKLDKAIKEKCRFLDKKVEKESNTVLVLPCGHTEAHIMRDGAIKCVECGNNPLKIIYEKTEDGGKEWFEVPFVVWGVVDPDDVDLENTTLINPNPEVN